jgi:hypothetical protein
MLLLKTHQLTTKNNNHSFNPKKHQLRLPKKKETLLKTCAAAVSAIARTKRTGHIHAVDVSQLSAVSSLLVF